MKILNFRIGTALSLALGCAPALAAAASSASRSSGSWTDWTWLPFTLALAVATHVLLGRGLKAVLSAVNPMASGAVEACGYERTVYGTPGRDMHEIVAGVLASGVVLWLAIGLRQPWLVALSFVVFLAALALDLSRWERVAASADFVWFQRGLREKLHQVAIENIRDVSITEQDVEGFSFRHGSHNRVCRLNLRMNDKRVVALPKTNAHQDLERVESVANHIRKRQQFVKDMTTKRHGGELRPAPQAGAGSPSQSEQDMLRALKRLRKQAAAAPTGSDLPPTLDGDAPPPGRSTSKP